MIAKNKLDCCGCQKCKMDCPVGAIELKADQAGFVYPVINKSKCLSCNKCSASCTFKNRLKDSIETSSKSAIYAAKNRSEIDRMNSRSGGIFTAISDEFIFNDNIVYGCLLDDKWNVKHEKANDLIIRNKFRGSKYVQSNIASSFSSVKKDLDSGKYVLFTGTPCQVDAIQSCIKNNENLYTLDVICYGVSSPQFWADYIQYIEHKYNGKVEQFDFRDKRKFGWKAHNESFVINEKKYYSREYSYFFKKQLSLRPSCFQCPYKTPNRISDITLGDFWGIDKVCPEFYDNMGISLVMINTEKGQVLWEKIKHKIIYQKISSENYMQPSLTGANGIPDLYTSFWNDYAKNGFSFVLNKYYDE